MSWFIFGESLCSHCRNQMKGQWKKIKKLDMEVFSIYPYQNFQREVLLKFKDSHDKWLADVFLSPYLLRFYGEFWDHTIIFVPSHISQIDKRGYSPNLELIKQVKLGYLENILYKKYPYKQSTMHRDVRSNIKDVMGIKDIDQIKDKKILLFDDLITSGNSLKASYDLLKPHVKSIKVFALFHHEI